MQAIKRPVLSLAVLLFLAGSSVGADFWDELKNLTPEQRAACRRVDGSMRRFWQKGEGSLSDRVQAAYQYIVENPKAEKLDARSVIKVLGKGAPQSTAALKGATAPMAVNESVAKAAAADLRELRHQFAASDRLFSLTKARPEEVAEVLLNKAYAEAGKQTAVSEQAFVEGYIHSLGKESKDLSTRAEALLHEMKEGHLSRVTLSKRAAEATSQLESLESGSKALAGDTLVVHISPPHLPMDAELQMRHGFPPNGPSAFGPEGAGSAARGAEGFSGMSPASAAGGAEELSTASTAARSAGEVGTRSAAAAGAEELGSSGAAIKNEMGLLRSRLAMSTPLLDLRASRLLAQQGGLLGLQSEGLATGLPRSALAFESNGLAPGFARSAAGLGYVPRSATQLGETATFWAKFGSSEGAASSASKGIGGLAEFGGAASASKAVGGLAEFGSITAAAKPAGSVLGGLGKGAAAAAAAAGAAGAAAAGAGGKKKSGKETDPQT
jgi:hypothetical protein